MPPMNKNQLPPRRMNPLPKAEVREFETPVETPTTGRWTCHPIQRFKISRFQFENGLLELTKAADVAEFTQMLSELPMTERMRIKDVDITAAEKVVADYIAQQGKVTQVMDSSIGERASDSPKLGVGRLEDLNATTGEMADVSGVSTT